MVWRYKGGFVSRPASRADQCGIQRGDRTLISIYLRGSRSAAAPVQFCEASTFVPITCPGHSGQPASSTSEMEAVRAG